MSGKSWYMFSTHGTDLSMRGTWDYLGPVATGSRCLPRLMHRAMPYRYVYIYIRIIEGNMSNKMARSCNMFQKMARRC